MTDNTGKVNSAFSFDTITDFDKHISMSIPQYEIMLESIIRLSDYFKDESKVVYDIGTSTGKLLKYFKRTNNYKGKLVGIDNCLNLLPNSNDDTISFVNHDLTTPFNFNNACIVYSLYTMQFLPRESRQSLLDAIYSGLCKGGALFICEKTYLTSGMFQDMFSSAYYDYKKQSFTEKEIFDKERSLRTLLKPNTEAENLNMLYSVGFRKIEKFYQYFQFGAYLCVK